ncbi:MAG: hypothetical protein BGO07_01640 [Alphaproteobacteria bacterium 40-19]|nr:MAG: hypothetical protein BGO07_01640 [Alphaproteobacteria bacterium 40-19]
MTQKRTFFNPILAEKRFMVKEKKRKKDFLEHLFNISEKTVSENISQKLEAELNVLLCSFPIAKEK